MLSPFTLTLACMISTSSWARSMDLKYLTVFTWSSWTHLLIVMRSITFRNSPAVASSSVTIRAHGWSWRAESVHLLEEIKARGPNVWNRRSPDGSHLPLWKCKRHCNTTVQVAKNLPMALLSARAFRWPVTMTTTSRASRIVATPTVRAIRGTAEISLLKKRAFARIVS